MRARRAASRSRSKDRSSGGSSASSSATERDGSAARKAPLAGLFCTRGKSGAKRGAQAMKFIDEADVRVQAGSGGDGCGSFRRGEFIPRGGPLRGDGRGGRTAR